MTLKVIATVRNLCESSIVKMYHLVTVAWLSAHIGV